MLKVSLSSSEFTALSDELKGHYKLTSSGEYKLDLGDIFTTDKDPAGLVSALEKEREENIRVRKVADLLEEEKKKAEAEKLTDVNDVKEHYQKQLDDIRKSIEKDKKQQEAQLKIQKENSVKEKAKTQALKIAGEIFGERAALMLPHMENMIRGKISETGEELIEFLDATSGQPIFEQNPESFKKSVLSNDTFKPMIVVSKASGGSANDGTSNGLATNKEDGTPKKYSDFTSGELVSLKRNQPDLFEELKNSR